MDFEYDLLKSESNKIKHGIDFEEAKALWSDEDAIQFNTDTGEEQRFLIVGQIDEADWTPVITFRGEIIRIISVRRSRNREKEEYDYRKGIRRKI
jgi:uncharacterized DUF497 family protein